MISDMRRGKVLATFPLHRAGVSALTALVDLEVADHDILDERELEPFLTGLSALIVGSTPIGTATLAQAANLKVIGRHGTGLDNIDLVEATRQGIVVTYEPDALTQSVAEHTLALILALARSLLLADRLVRAGQWRDALPHLGTELAGKTLGVIGLGRIGTKVAEMARSALGMQVVAFDPFAQLDHNTVGDIALVKDLPDLLPRVDVLSLHAPLTAQTHHLIGRVELACMRRSAYLVNTSRGALVVPEALVSALRHRRLAGAALDTFVEEPLLGGNPLLDLDNVILTPHIASHTEQAMSRLAAGCAAQVLAVLAGRRPASIANPEVWEQRRGVKGAADE
jgi:D-3-phosphoglycerate dehydrogenase / 2-oxoglutarate reductase